MQIETLKNFVQSGNINFLIGSGLSRPYLPVLGNIEKQMETLKSVPSDKRKIVKAVLYKEYFQKVILPNLVTMDRGDSYKATLKNYTDFLKVWNNIIHNRCSSIRSKQINLFSTNIDLFVENAAETTGVEFNDGFIGSVKPMFSETNFQKTVFKNSIHFQNSTELPIFNLLKIHGSVNWQEIDGKVINDYNLQQVNTINEILSKYRTGVFPEYCDSNDKILEQIKGDDDFSDFISAYGKMLIVNPTKRKFSETVLDVHFYELMRLFSNNLEKENTLLFVMGFSFADEHIRSIVKRALKTNPTLIVIVFSYTDDEKANYVKLFGEKASNLVIMSPSDYNAANNLEGENAIRNFDFQSINSVFDQLSMMIPVHFGDGK